MIRMSTPQEELENLSRIAHEKGQILRITIDADHDRAYFSTSADQDIYTPARGVHSPEADTGFYSHEHLTGDEVFDRLILLTEQVMRSAVDQNWKVDAGGAGSFTIPGCAAPRLIFKDHAEDYDYDLTPDLAHREWDDDLRPADNSPAP